MKLNKKKGFTIVELVIVIAIIGVLAAVLIPTFVRLIRKARINSDTQLVKHLNSALSTDAVEHEHNTMTDALKAASDFGFSVDKINVKVSENEIYWDSKNDVFCYYNDGKIEYIPESISSDKALKDNEQHMLWEIVDKAMTADQIANLTHSVYLATEAAADSFNNKTVHVGVDTGIYTVENLTYENTTSTAKNIVIRTNGGNLTINAKKDTVDHYGTSDKVDVVAIASASYHENGTVQLIAVKEGHVKLEVKADVNGIYVYNNSDGSIKDTSFEEIKITVTQGVEVPKLSRSAVEIDDEGTKVCTIVTDQAKDVYLFNEGIYEQIRTVDEGKPITDASATWADSNENTANTQTAAQQLANEWSGAAAPTWSSTDITREIENITNKAEVAGIDETEYETAEELEAAIEAVWENKTTVTEAGKTSEEAQIASALKGTGTQSDPFLVYDFDTMQKISEFYDLGYYYFEVALDKTDKGKIDCSGWVPVKLHGSFDGKGVRFTNVTAVLFQMVGYQLQNENIVLKNFDATMNVSANGQYGAAALIKNIFNAGTTTFSNVNVHGYLEGFWNMGSFYNYGTANYDDIGCDYEVVFNDCLSDATLVCGSGNTCGGFAGHSYEGAGNQFIMRINNSSYTGTIFTTTGKAGAYIAMSSNHGASGENGNYIYVDGVRVEFNDGNNMTAYYYGNTTKITKVNPTKAQNGYVIAKQTNVAKIVVTITAQLTAYDSNNVKIPNLSGITMTLSNAEITDFEGSSVKVYDLFNSINISKYATESSASVSNNRLNINLDTSSNYKSGNVRLQVNQYDAAGNIVSAGTIDIATCNDATSQWVIQ